MKIKNVKTSLLILSFNDKNNTRYFAAENIILVTVKIHLKVPQNASARVRYQSDLLLITEQYIALIVLKIDYDNISGIFQNRDGKRWHSCTQWR